MNEWRQAMNRRSMAFKTENLDGFHIATAQFARTIYS
jgi:hypothetical protein